MLLVRQLPLDACFNLDKLQETSNNENVVMAMSLNTLGLLMSLCPWQCLTTTATGSCTVRAVRRGFESYKGIVAVTACPREQ